MKLRMSLKTLLGVIIITLAGCRAPDSEDEVMNEQAVALEEGEVEGGNEGEGPEVDQGSEQMDFPQYAQQMLVLVNRVRAMGATCGGEVMPAVPPLSLNPLLNEASLLHAQDMAEQSYFEHTSLDGREPWDRMIDAGYRGRAYGENIAAGNAGAGATFDQWLNSPGHCTNMMSADFSELGVGYFALRDSIFTHYWVQNFGRP